MKLEQVALTLYTLRNRLKTPEEIESTVRRVREIGYAAVQISGLNWDVISELEMLALCRDNGLTICATHEPADMILESPAKVVDRLRALECKYTAYPYPSDIDFGNAAAVDELIVKLDRAGRILAQAGLVLAYHNHQIEFRKLGQQTILERIFEKTDPAHLQGELDTYWVQYGGADPVRWCRKLKGRLPLLHLKDLAINEKNEVVFAEIGSGNLDFPAITKAAEEGGCEWFIVEQDTCPGDEFESIAMSLEYIKSRLVT